MAQTASYQNKSDLLDRYALALVSTGAFILLRFIFNWTVRLGKTRNAITYDQFIEGITIGGVLQQAGVGGSKSTVARHITELRKAGFVKVSKVHGRYDFPHNEFEIDFNAIEAVIMSTLRVPKSRQNSNKNTSTEMTPTPCQNLTGIVSKVYASNRYINSGSISKEIRRDSRASGFDSIKEAVETTSKKTADARSKKAGNMFTAKGLTAMWQKAMLTTYPTVPVIALTVKEFSIAKKRLYEFAATNDVYTFLVWAVENWTVLRSSKFAWLMKQNKTLTVAPDLHELLRYWKTFVRAYAEGVAQVSVDQAKATLTAPEKLALELEKTKAALAHATDSNKKLSERLGRAERMLSTPTEPKVKRTSRSLSESMKLAEETYSEEVALPNWGT